MEGTLDVCTVDTRGVARTVLVAKLFYSGIFEKNSCKTFILPGFLKSRSFEKLRNFHSRPLHTEINSKNAA